MTDGNKNKWELEFSDDERTVFRHRDKHRIADVSRHECIIYTRLMDRPSPESRQDIHICDIDDEIERLQQLKQAIKDARSLVTWPGGYWS